MDRGKPGVLQHFSSGLGYPRIDISDHLWIVFMPLWRPQNGGHVDENSLCRNIESGLSFQGVLHFEGFAAGG